MRRLVWSLMLATLVLVAFAKESAGTDASNRACGAIALAPTHGEPGDLCISAHYVFWTVSANPGKGGSIWRVAKAGGSEQRVADEPPGMTDLACDDDALYMIVRDLSTLVRFNVNGGTTWVLLGKQRTMGWLAIDETYVYWTDWRRAFRILRMPKTGGRPTVLVPRIEGPGTSSLLLDGLIYWYDGGGTLYSVPKQGGVPTKLCEVGQYANRMFPELASDADNVYVGSQLSVGDTGDEEMTFGNVFKVSKRGQAEPTFADRHLLQLKSLTGDGQAVYWNNGQSIQRLPAGGGKISVVMTVPESWWKLRSDATALYWLSRNEVKMLRW